MRTSTGLALDRGESLLGVVLLAPRDGRRWRPWRLAPVWVLTRVLLLLLIVVTEGASSDVGYYFHAMRGDVDGLPAGLREYPVPATWVLSIPALSGSTDWLQYRLYFFALMLVVDAAFTLALHRLSDRGRAVTLWLAAGVLLGPLVLTRFDLLTGCAVGAALLLHQRRPAWAGALAAAAAAIKIWPAVLLPLLAGARSGRRRFLAAAIAVLGVAVIATTAIGGIDRLVSPLRYQADRGIQVESAAALPLMLAWAARGAPWTVGYSEGSRSEEVSGPGDSIVMAVSALATAAVVGLVVLYASRLWRRPSELSTRAIGWAVLAASTLLVLANKVFSPQYLIWLVPVAVAIVAVSPERTARRCAMALLVAGFLGQLIYPALYGLVIHEGTFSLVGVALLATRLCVIAAVALVAVERAWILSEDPLRARHVRA